MLAQTDFRDGAVPVIPNCDPDCVHSRERTLELLARQITSPVRWRETVERMAALGVDTIVELGPKRVLSGLIRRIDKRLSVEDSASLDRTVAALKGRAKATGENTHNPVCTGLFCKEEVS